jgi:hypothetical protein
MISQVNELPKISILEILFCILIFIVASIYPITNYLITSYFQVTYKENGKKIFLFCFLQIIKLQFRNNSF